METRIDVGPDLRDLITEMLRMLITYEMELTAYYLVLKHAQDLFIQKAVPWDMESNVRAMLKTPSLQVEAEAMYAPFYELLQQLTPENLRVALASIKRRIADHEANIPPEDAG